MLMRLNCFIILAVNYLKDSAYNMYKKIGPAIKQTLQKYYRNINTEGQLRSFPLQWILVAVEFV